MKESLLKFLCCPVTLKDLELKIFEQKKKEIKSGLLVSPSGFIFPIVNEVPRMLIESFLDYEDFLKKQMSDYITIKNKILKNYTRLINHCIKKNKRTKQSFAFEWSIFKYETDKTWHWDREIRIQMALKKIQENEKSLMGKTLVDIGCGNGVLTSDIAEFGAETVAMDLSSSVEKAQQYNTQASVHFIQGDLQIPPFKPESFDIVYSSGVIHHTNNTELSFSCINELAKKGGKLYIWVYHPIEDWIHRFLITLRKFTHKLPLWLQFWLYFIFLLPISHIAKNIISGGKHNWREQMVDLLDTLSPEFRYEHTPNEVKTWYIKRNYHTPVVTANDHFGFGVLGVKKDKN